MSAKFYAGIGSRETPEHIQAIMHHCAAFLYGQGWHLRSGGADGADRSFEAGHDFIKGQHEDLDKKEIFLPWRRYNDNQSMLHPGMWPFEKLEADTVEKFHPRPDALSQGAYKLHMRNVRILRGLTGAERSKFVICWTQNGAIRGGTGMALRIAQDRSIPVINFGSAKTPAELEALVIKVDMLQRSL
jgi:hypothetical protein